MGVLTNKMYTRAFKLVPQSLTLHSLLNLIPHSLSCLHYPYAQIQSPLPLPLPNPCLYHCHRSALISPAKRTICKYSLTTLLDKFLIRRGERGEVAKQLSTKSKPWIDFSHFQIKVNH